MKWEQPCSPIQDCQLDGLISRVWSMCLANDSTRPESGFDGLDEREEEK
jgi:hypothetical protein